MEGVFGHRAPMHMIPLTDDEKVVLAALMKALVTADDEVSPQEEARLSRVIRFLGPQTFGLAEDLVATDEVAVRRCASRVARPEAQQAMHAALTDAALVDGMHPTERAFLAIVADAWGILAATGDG